MADQPIPPDVTTHVLIQIREEMHQANERLGRLERGQSESGMRIATELTLALGKIISDVRELIAAMRQDHQRMAAIEDRIAQLEKKGR